MPNFRVMSDTNCFLHFAKRDKTNINLDVGSDFCWKEKGEINANIRGQKSVAAGWSNLSKHAISYTFSRKRLHALFSVQQIPKESRHWPDTHHRKDFKNVLFAKGFMLWTLLKHHWICYVLSSVILFVICSLPWSLLLPKCCAMNWSYIWLS